MKSSPSSYLNIYKSGALVTLFGSMLVVSAIKEKTSSIKESTKSDIAQVMKSPHIKEQSTPLDPTERRMVMEILSKKTGINGDTIDLTKEVISDFTFQNHHYQQVPFRIFAKEMTRHGKPHMHYLVRLYFPSQTREESILLPTDME